MDKNSKNKPELAVGQVWTDTYNYERRQVGKRYQRLVRIEHINGDTIITRTLRSPEGVPLESGRVSRMKRQTFLRNYRYDEANNRVKQTA